MRLDPQDLKAIIDSVGKLVEARAQTTEINLKAHVTDHVNQAKEELKEEMHEVKDEMQAIKHELKTDIHNLRTGVAKKLIDHDHRLEALEKTRKTNLKN